MVEPAEETKPKTEPVAATQEDFLLMFYLLLRQNEVTEDNAMQIDVRAFKTIPKNARISGTIEDGILSIFIPETKKQKNKRKREQHKKLLLPDSRLIVPN